MSRWLQARLARELRAGRKLFIPYLTAGDRGLDFTFRAVLALASAGADAIELGVPFSDPLADGPVIQRASERALARGTTLTKVIDLVRRVRTRSQVPILLMGYLNPFLSPSLESVADRSQGAGVDGFIIPDLPPEEAGAWTRLCRARDLDTVFLAAPTSTQPRLRAVARASTGYVYYVSVTGTTGMRQALPPDLGQGIARLRRVTRLPILVGFGISAPDQARQVSRLADGVIVGSALVRTLEPGPSDASSLSRLRTLASRMSRAAKNGWS
jgi:tryptophan synthase alpha chain